MARPKKLQTVLMTDQLPIWSEAGHDPQPFPTAMLRRLAIIADEVFDTRDLAQIKKVSDAMRDWYALCVPSEKAVTRDTDQWEELARAFAAADAGNPKAS